MSENGSENGKGRWIGAGIGLLLGLIFLIVGFWKMVFFALLVGVGYFIGHQIDRKQNLKEVIDAILLDKWMRK